VFTTPSTAAEAKVLQSLLQLDAPYVLLTRDRVTDERLRTAGPTHPARGHSRVPSQGSEVTVVALKPVGLVPATLPLGENPLVGLEVEPLQRQTAPSRFRRSDVLGNALMVTGCLIRSSYFFCPNAGGSPEFRQLLWPRNDPFIWLLGIRWHIEAGEGASIFFAVEILPPL
jgi:hypothetical protein